MDRLKGSSTEKIPLVPLKATAVHKTADDHRAAAEQLEGVAPCVADDQGEPVVGADDDVILELGVAYVAGNSKPLALPAAVSIICQVQGPSRALWAAASKMNSLHSQ